MIKPLLFSSALVSTVLSSSAASLLYGLDFTDPGWMNDTTNGPSEFQTNGDGRGNFAGWDSTHTLSNINGSGIGVTMSLSHKPNSWNIESRPSLETYFPSEHGNPGDILRVWNDTDEIPNGEFPAVTLEFSEAVTLQELGLEGYRRDDAFKIQAFDMSGNLIAPNWADPSVSVTTNPGDPLSDVPINLLSGTGVNGATGADAPSSGSYLDTAAEMAFLIRNENRVNGRGAAIVNFNLDTALVSKIVFSMIEVDSNGVPTGDPSYSSMYIAGGFTADEFAVPVPEPSGVSLMIFGTFGILLRRKR